jgi:hypothetical protein
LNGFLGVIFGSINGLGYQADMAIVGCKKNAWTWEKTGVSLSMLDEGGAKRHGAENGTSSSFLSSRDR